MIEINKKSGRIIRKRIKIRGVVQGVGFRPFIYKLAKSHKLSGFVYNNTEGVVVEVQGSETGILKFIFDIERKSPPLSQIESISHEEISVSNDGGFIIKPSESEKEKFVLLSPDIATCEDCLNELFDPEDRRYKYPFINCTNCGPRFTIIRDIPYDRPKTTMSSFKMCVKCKNEYEDPENRRFHAQPNACPEDGPHVLLGRVENRKWRDGNEDQSLADTGKTSEGSNWELEIVDVENPIDRSRELLREGKIIAIKGLGGYHLACDAANEDTVRRLRGLKQRGDKPFALMAEDIDMIKRFCSVTKEEEAILCSPQRPIVLLDKAGKNVGIKIAESVAPKQETLGVMLPYTPLHHILFRDSNLVLVMTSGNLRNEPIVYKDDDAFSKLGDIADFFMTHNREIYTRCDDSVARSFNGEEMMVRRSRGYVPQPIELPFAVDDHILACGAEVKNVFALARDNYAFLSHYIGDLENLEILEAFEEGITHFEYLFSIRPGVVAYDLHPEYLSSKFAKRKYASGDFKLVGVQHHEAHVASVIADRGVGGEVIGVALDGLGYGSDGNFWGGEFFVGDCSNFKRAGQFEYIPMPGGVMAIKEPWRMAMAYIDSVYGERAVEVAQRYLEGAENFKLQAIKSMLKSRINTPITSSVGRLFDAVSALLGVCGKVTYEGQAAIELEAVSSTSAVKPFDYELVNNAGYLTVKPGEIFEGIIGDIERGESVTRISNRFHATIIDIIKNTCYNIREMYKLSQVVLSGGVFQNKVILEGTVNILRVNGFEVYVPYRVPVNDGCISLGQIMIASCKERREQ
ncbi:carbamoyltransferase HypF [bacterium]|nr:carbamoyltransferase HypF [bacterium]